MAQPTEASQKPSVRLQHYFDDHGLPIGPVALSSDEAEELYRQIEAAGPVPLNDFVQKMGWEEPR